MDNNYRIPRDSVDLYRRGDFFSRIYGPDFFFAAGWARTPSMPDENNFSTVENVSFFLSNRVAWNPNPPSAGNPKIHAAREDFLEYRDKNPGQFPDYREVRAGQVEELQLISGGAAIFFMHDFGKGLEAKLTLFRRGAPPKVMSEANGLVGSQNTAEKEMVEEYTPVMLLAESAPIVLALQFEHKPTYSERDLLNVKRAQQETIIANLARQDIRTDFLGYAAMLLEPIMPGTHSINLVDPTDGHIVGRLTGNIGFEHDHNTWVYRKAGLAWVPRNGKMILIDGEYDRTGGFYGPEELAAMIEAKDTLSSTAAMGKYYLENWPQPVSGVFKPVRGQPRVA